MTKFRKKPVVIDAVQWTGSNVQDIFQLGITELRRRDWIPPTGKIYPGGALIFILRVCGMILATCALAVLSVKQSLWWLIPLSVAWYCTFKEIFREN